jgi:hypothetical protein
MFDYAANAVAYWPVEKIRAEYEANCTERGVGVDEEVEALVGQHMDVDQFWQAVKTNLQAGKIRMVFVADMIPTELQRIVEFLNQQMDPAEVLAVEIKQYVGQGGLKTLVPRVIGKTIEAEDRKSVSRGPTRQWDELSFFDLLTSKKGDETAAIAKAILAWANGQGLSIRWGRGSKDGSFSPYSRSEGEALYLFSVWTYGQVEIQFQYMTSPPLEALRPEILHRLNAVPGVVIADDRISRRPSFQLTTLREQEVLRKFLDVFDWAIARIQTQ